MDEPAHEDLPQGDEPGAATTPYDDGKGTIGLSERIGGAAPDTNQGKTEPMPATPGHTDPEGTGPHTDPPQAPELGDMNVGAADPQIASPSGSPVGGAPAATLGAPTAGAGGPRPPAESETASRLAAAGAQDAAGAGTLPSEGQPGSVTASSTGTDLGPEMPESQSSGTAHRAPGLQGEAPEGESVDVDAQLGADRMVPGAAPDRTDPQAEHGTHDPGDAQGVAVNSHEAAEGTSEEQTIAHGVKDPTAGMRGDA